MLDLENTQLTIDRAQTFGKDRVDKMQTPKDLVASTTAHHDIMQQLAVLQEKVAAFEVGQSGFSVRGGGRGGGMLGGHGRGRGTLQGVAGGSLSRSAPSVAEITTTACVSRLERSWRLKLLK